MLETTALVLVGVMLAVAVIYDLALDVGNDHRIAADEATWTRFTGLKPVTIWAKPVSLGQTTDISCGSVAIGPHVRETQVCVVLVGPVRNGLRTVFGAWQLRWGVADHRADRFGCVGGAVSPKWCPR
jgi:hypothetical protein